MSGSLTRPQARHSRIDDLEILRAIAIIFTLLAHRNSLLIWKFSRPPDSILDYMDFGWGVDLFFVISGFIIARSLMTELLSAKRPKGPLVVAFWIKRFWRLAPTSGLWICVALMLSFFFNASGAFGPPHVMFQAALSAFSNTMNIHEAAVELLEGHSSWGLSPFWSLSTEEQFYLVLPLTMVVLGAPRRLAIAATVFALLQFLIPGRTVPNYAWFLRTDGLCAGVLIALTEAHPVREYLEPTFLRAKRARWLFIGLILVVSTQSASAIRADISTLLACALVWAASYDREYLCAPGIVKRVALYLGSRSYSIYVIHCLVFNLPLEVWFRYVHDGPFDSRLTWFFIPPAMALLFVLSEANYRFVEQPLRQKGKLLAASYLQRSVHNVEIPVPVA